MELRSANIDTANFLTELKEATTKAHTDLELLPVASRMMRDDVTLAQYQDYLQIMFQLMHEVESRFFPLVNKIFSDLSNRQKNQWICQDLTAMGISPKSKNASIFTISEETVPFYAGILYVIEGSTLGGRYILQNITSQLDLNQTPATTFLHGYGNKTGSMWKEFTKQLLAVATDSDAANDIIRGAQFAFDGIHNHFNTPLV